MVALCPSTGNDVIITFYIIIHVVTAEICLIWTNATGTNVAWAKVTVTVGIGSRCTHELTFKVWSK